MWISYLGVFICVISAYDVYEEKKTALFISPIILLTRLIFAEINFRVDLFSRMPNQNFFVWIYFCGWSNFSYFVFVFK